METQTQTKKRKRKVQVHPQMKDAIIQDLRNGALQATIARKYNISDSVVSNIYIRNVKGKYSSVYAKPLFNESSDKISKQELLNYLNGFIDALHFSASTNEKDNCKLEMAEQFKKHINTFN